MLQRMLLSLLAAGLATSSAATAQTAAAPDPVQVRRLSPEEKERILANSNEQAADAALNSALGGGSRTESSGIHGEIGAVVGTGGTRGVFGTALIPLGDRGAAILSFEDFRTDTVRRRRR